MVAGAATKAGGAVLQIHNIIASLLRVEID